MIDLGKYGKWSEETLIEHAGSRRIIYSTAGGSVYSTAGERKFYFEKYAPIDGHVYTGRYATKTMWDDLMKYEGELSELLNSRERVKRTGEILNLLLLFDRLRKKISSLEDKIDVVSKVVIKHNQVFHDKKKNEDQQ